MKNFSVLRMSCVTAPQMAMIMIMMPRADNAVCTGSCASRWLWCRSYHPEAIASNKPHTCKVQVRAVLRRSEGGAAVTI